MEKLLKIFNIDGENLQRFILSLEDTFLEKPKGGRGCQIDPPAV